MPPPRPAASSVAAKPDRPSKEEVLTAYRRSAILESARQVFGECGFDRATIDRIAHEAGVAKGTIYLYYASKQRIYDDALNGALEELAELTRDRLARATSLRDAIAGFITTRADYFVERRGVFRMYVASVSSRFLDDATLRPSDCRVLMERQTQQLEAVIAKAVAAREIRRVDPASTAMAIFDLTRGLVMRQLLEPDASSLARESSQLVDLIWHGLSEPRLAPSRGGTGKR